MLKAFCRIVVVCSVLLLPPSIAQAQTNQADCLKEWAEGSRLSGKLVLASRLNSDGVTYAMGYKLILLKPRCYEYLNPESQKLTRTQITEVQLLLIGDTYAKRNTGKFLTVTGVIMSLNVGGYVSWPQMEETSRAPCEIVPTSKNIEKCR